MNNKLSRTKELVVASAVELSSPQRSRLPIMPFAVLLPSLGLVTTLHEEVELLERRLEELLALDEDRSKEISMLQQVLIWLRMGAN